MPEAVIVAAARSPIGRAYKGSLAATRPDDLLLQMFEAALRQVPALDPRTVDDVVVGCAQPAGEQGYNLGRQLPNYLTVSTAIRNLRIQVRSASNSGRNNFSR